MPFPIDKELADLALSPDSYCLARQILFICKGFDLGHGACRVQADVLRCSGVLRLQDIYGRSSMQRSMMSRYVYRHGHV